MLPSPEQHPPEQMSLFTAKDVAGRYGVNRRTRLAMRPEVLHTWKQRVITFQHRVECRAPIAQTSLFELPTPTRATDPDAINPFTLPQQNTQFWRWRAEDAGVAALYFVIDYELPLLLYVGETVHSNQRWKGEHDCKRYLLNYQQTHYELNLPTQLGVAFWQDAPTGTRDRQKLESALIAKWRSPFNKENWAIWNTPFVNPT
jgi:hypothetical protein